MRKHVHLTDAAQGRALLLSARVPTEAAERPSVVRAAVPV